MAATIDDMAGSIFDSRDAIARIKELADLEEWSDLNDDETAELAALRELESEASGYIVDWQYGETFIPESAFEDYARELASDVSDYNARDEQWPYTYIDWPAAAEALKQDYTAIEWRGVTYYAR